MRIQSLILLCPSILSDSSCLQKWLHVHQSNHKPFWKVPCRHYIYWIKSKPDYLQFMLLWHNTMIARIIAVCSWNWELFQRQTNKPTKLPLPYSPRSIHWKVFITCIWSFSAASRGACRSNHLKQSSQHFPPAASCTLSPNHCIWASSWH